MPYIKSTALYRVKPLPCYRVVGPRGFAADYIGRGSRKQANATALRLNTLATDRATEAAQAEIRG